MVNFLHFSLIGAVFVLLCSPLYINMLQSKAKPHLDLDWPAEVGHVDIEGDVVVDPEVKLLAGKAVTVLLNVGLGYDGHLLPRDGAGYKTDRCT